jgi:hypothetical protein
VLVRSLAILAFVALAGCADDGVVIKADGTRESPRNEAASRMLVRDGSPMHDARGDHFAMRLEGHRVLVMGGGPTSVEIYDADRDQWTHWDDLPSGLGWVAAAQIDDDDVWVLLSSFEPMRYRISTKKLTPVAPLPFTACATSYAALPSGKIVAIGGQDCGRPGETVPDVAMYDPTRDAWSAHAPLHHSRSFASVSSAATSMGDTILVRGGGELAERWDPRVDAWIELLDDPKQPADLRPGSASVDLGDGRTVITGGLEGCGRTCLHPLARTVIVTR